MLGTMALPFTCYLQARKGAIGRSLKSFGAPCGAPMNVTMQWLRYAGLAEGAASGPVEGPKVALAGLVVGFGGRGGRPCMMSST